MTFYITLSDAVYEKIKLYSSPISFVGAQAHPEVLLLPKKNLCKLNMQTKEDVERRKETRNRIKL